MGNSSSSIWALRRMGHLTATSPQHYAQFGVRTGRFCSRESTMCLLVFHFCLFFSSVAPCSSLLLIMSAEQPHPYQWHLFSRTSLAELGSFLNLSSREHSVLHLDRGRFSFPHRWYVDTLAPFHSSSTAYRRTSSDQMIFGLPVFFSCFLGAFYARSFGYLRSLFPHQPRASHPPMC